MLIIKHISAMTLIKSHSPVHHGYNFQQNWHFWKLWQIFLQYFQLPWKLKVFLVDHKIFWSFRLQSLQHRIRNSRPRYPTNYGNSRSPLSLSPVDENQELLRSPWTSLGVLLLTNKTGQSFPKQSSSSQEDSNPLMLQQTHPGPSMPSVTSVKSFHGQICNLSWVLCFTFQPCSTITKQSCSFSGAHSLSKWVHILDECLLKGTFTSLGQQMQSRSTAVGAQGQTSPTTPWKEERKSRKPRCGNTGIFQSTKKSKLGL